MNIPQLLLRRCWRTCSHCCPITWQKLGCPPCSIHTGISEQVLGQGGVQRLVHNLVPIAQNNFSRFVFIYNCARYKNGQLRI